MTPFDLLDEECKYLNLIFENTDADKMMIICLCAKIHFAFKCSMISGKDHHVLIDKARSLLYGGA